MRVPRLRSWCAAVLAGVWLAHSVFALDPSKAFSQYVHDYWDSDSGFPGGAVYAICQSGDGYLWIGTERGLVRFDGFQFKLIQIPIPNAAPVGAVRGLVSDAEGNLWIRIDGPRLLVYRDSRFEDAYARYGLDEQAFTTMSLDTNGNLILWGFRNRTLRFRNGQFQRYGEGAGAPGTVIAAAETPDGRLWMGTRDIGLYSIDRNRVIKSLDGLPTVSVNALLSAGANLWVGTGDGLYSLSGETLKRTSSRGLLKNIEILSLAKDGAGTVWLGTGRGLVRMTAGNGISGEYLNQEPDEAVTAVYADREGDIWYGGPHGIERLRDGIFTKYTTAQGLPAESNGPIYVDRDGRIWFAPATGGIDWLKDGKIGKVSADGLDGDMVYSISGGDGEIWLGREHGGLTRLIQRGDSWVAHTYKQSEGLAQNSVYSVHRNRDGTVWAGTVNGGLCELKEGHFTSFSAGKGPSSNAVFSIVESKNGTMWFATPNGLDSFSHGIWKNFSVQDGLPSSNIRSIFEDSHQTLWIATAAGLAAFSAGHVMVVQSQIDSLHEEILGLTEDSGGDLWIVTPDHVLRVNRESLIQSTVRESEVISYGLKDGLPGVQGVRRDRSVITDNTGRIWISLAQGLASTDPLATGSPVTARIESIELAGAIESPLGFHNLPAGTRSIGFDFASTDISAPERIRYRYRLDGASQQWSEDVETRRVFYANLGPGVYRFRILASNGSGIWNGPESVYDFEIEPAFWQTWWFRISCILLGSLLAAAAYQWRLMMLTNRLNERFKDRLAERLRIAQELHDTLLQGVLSASLQLDIVGDQTPPEAPTQPQLRRVLELLKQVTEEGRSALRGLRSSDDGPPNMERALSRLGDEFSANEHLSYRVIVQGKVEPLRPMIRDDVYRIAREAVLNAFRHAKASNIEVELEYAERYFRILVRDDGRGIDSETLEAGRAGHWGLPGMRERSEFIQSNLKLSSRKGMGTEMELTVPGSIAFGGESSRRRLGLRKHDGTQSEDERIGKKK